MPKGHYERKLPRHISRSLYVGDEIVGVLGPIYQCKVCGLCRRWGADGRRRDVWWWPVEMGTWWPRSHVPMLQTVKPCPGALPAMEAA